jgi:hypothetical protein
MVKSKNRIVAFMLLVLMTLTMLLSSFTPIKVEAAASDAYTNLLNVCMNGTITYTKGTKDKIINVASNRYKMSSGGTILYVSLWNTSAAADQSADLFTNDFDDLTAGAKQDFLKDVFTVANAKVDADDINGVVGVGAVTNETVTDMTNVMQQQTGMGASLLASLLQNTKPDYTTANRIYEPFSGVVGTILGIIAIIIMSALGITMALDLAYITIPAFQMAMGGSDESGNGTKGKGIGGIISQEAKSAVKAADGGQGGQSGDGSYKAAVGIYFKYRWKGLVLLGICLLYLVQGQIYSFVAWFIDLFSGFLGF